MYQFVSPLIEHGVLLKKEVKCKNDTQSNCPRYLHRLEHMQWVQGLQVGVVSSKYMDGFIKTWDETYQKSVQENQKRKKKPLFLKHLNGWHQNVKHNTHFKKILNVYSYVTTSKKTKHIKNRN